MGIDANPEWLYLSVLRLHRILGRYIRKRLSAGETIRINPAVIEILDSLQRKDGQTVVELKTIIHISGRRILGAERTIQAMISNLSSMDGR